MNKRALLLLNDASASCKVEQLLNLLDYVNVEILQCHGPELDNLLLTSPDLVIVGSTFIGEENLASFIEKIKFLELPVIFLSSSAETHFYKYMLEKIMGNVDQGLKPLHHYLIEEIYEGKNLINRRCDLNNTVTMSFQNNDNALFFLKELKCLYFISDIMSLPNLPINAIIKYIHGSIEKAIGYNDDVMVRISCLENVYVSDNFRKSKIKIESPINVDDRNIGEIEVFYHHHASDREYLLKMENDFINAISERIGNYVKGRESIIKLEKKNEDLRKLSSHLQNVRENERKMVASTIHDEFGQKLITLRYQVLNVKKKIQQGDEDLDSSLNEMLNLINGSIETVRKISSDLRPGVLDKLGIAAAIEWLAQDIKNRTAIKFTVNCSPEDMILNDDYTTALFRIFQEATTNIVRHSCATEVIVNLKLTDSDIVLIILDNGKGISDEEINRDDSFGIKGMRERVLSFQGNFSIINYIEGGTILKASLPLSESSR